MDGLYSQKFDYPPETIISHSFFLRNPEYFYRFYREKMLPLGFEPNITHKVLARWEAEGKLSAVVTQNIDGLHQKAGSKRVFELHGSVLRNYCKKCGKFYGLDYILKTQGVPRCDCGSIVKPDVVLYEESLDQDLLRRALRYIAEADMLIIGGTSLNVYPAAGLVQYYSGRKLVLLNKGAVARDLAADLVLTDPIGEVLGQL